MNASVLLIKALSGGREGLGAPGQMARR